MHFPGWPRIVYMDVTGRCNGRCIICQRSSEYADIEACNWDIDKKIIDKTMLFVVNAESVDVTGYGEFLLSPHKENILGKCRESLTKVSMTTNGTFLSQNKNLIENTIGKFGRLVISIQSHKKELYEKLAPGLSYEAMIDGIKHASDLCESHVIVSHTIHEMNIEYLPEFIEWFLEQDGLEILEVQHIIMQRPAHKELSLTNHRKLSDKYIAMAMKYNSK